MYGYIYKTTNTVNNKIYIGQHKSEKFDESYIGSGKSFSMAVKKYGKENFVCEIVEACESRDSLNEREIYWISYYGSKDPSIGYNLADGGNYWSCGFHDGMLGKKQSDYQKECARRANTGKQVSEETRKKMSEASKLRTSYPAKNKGRVWVSDGVSQTIVDVEDAKRLEAEGFKLNSRVPKTEKEIQEIRDKYKNGTYVNKDGKDIFISNSDLSYYESLGYSVGKSKYPPERCKNVSEAKKGKICITDGKKNYFISKDEWYRYESLGYYKCSLYRLNNPIKK